MDPLPPGGRRPQHVTIVSDNPETLDGLESYLRRAGFTTSSTRQIEKSSEMTPAGSSVVLFPDDFASEAVMSALAALRAQRPAALAVLVTKEPKRFDSLPVSAGGLSPVVVPKPAWGWSILDAVRARSDSDPQ